MLTANLMLALLTLLWGLTFTATKQALATTDPMQFLALRFGLALPPMLLMLYIRKSREHMVSPRFAVVGVILFLGFALQTEGLRWTTASRSAFFTGLLVILTPMAASLFRTSRSHLTTWIGLPLALAGVGLLASPSLGGLNRGDMLTIGCAAAFSLQMVSLEWASGKESSDPFAQTAVQIAVVALLAGIWALIDGEPFRITREGFQALLYNAIFGTALATFLQTRWQPVVPAGHAALVFSLEPVFAALFATLLLGDRWSGGALAGAALILSAMVLSSIGLRISGPGRP
ncbi:MAG: hypothetical protein FJY67_06410 [Calditrichaeota bacterium]|nr:hypothetical protein [Calditrichota bacterium]